LFALIHVFHLLNKNSQQAIKKNITLSSARMADNCLKSIQNLNILTSRQSISATKRHTNAIVPTVILNYIKNSVLKKID
jgi:hypothetical protein